MRAVRLFHGVDCGRCAAVSREVSVVFMFLTVFVIFLLCVGFLVRGGGHTRRGLRGRF